MSSGFWLFILKFQVIKKRWILISSCTLIHTINNQSSETTLKSWFFGVAVLFGQYLNWILEAIFLCFQGTILCCGFINLTSEQVHTTCSMSVNIEELIKKKNQHPKIFLILAFISLPVYILICKQLGFMHRATYLVQSIQNFAQFFIHHDVILWIRNLVHISQNPQHPLPQNDSIVW